MAKKKSQPSDSGFIVTDSKPAATFSEVQNKALDSEEEKQPKKKAEKKTEAEPVIETEPAIEAEAAPTVEADVPSEEPATEPAE